MVATVSRLSVTVVTILINLGRLERLGCVHSYRIRAIEKAIDELVEQFGPKVFGGVDFQCLVSKPRNHWRHRKNGPWETMGDTLRDSACGGTLLGYLLILRR